MTTIISAFAEKQAALAAAQRLRDDGFAAELHEHLPAASNKASLEADEILSGGFVSNFSHLLNELLGTRTDARHADTYAELVRSAGTLVSVHVDEAADADRARATMHSAGATVVSSLPQAGLDE